MKYEVEDPPEWGRLLILFLSWLSLIVVALLLVVLLFKLGVL